MLDALPLTPNGKIDRRALPTPNGIGTILHVSFLGPRNTVELQLTQNLGGSPQCPTHQCHRQLLRSRWPLASGSALDGAGPQRFGRDLPLDTLFKAATLENLAAIIRQEAATAWSPLVEIQPGSSRKRLFFVHPAGGNIISYVALARYLGIEQPSDGFYGLQARALDGREEPFTRFEDMAAYYIDALPDKELQLHRQSGYAYVCLSDL